MFFFFLNYVVCWFLDFFCSRYSISTTLCGLEILFVGCFYVLFCFICCCCWYLLLLLFRDSRRYVKDEISVLFFCELVVTFVLVFFCGFFLWFFLFFLFRLQCCHGQERRSIFKEATKHVVATYTG